MQLPRTNAIGTFWCSINNYCSVKGFKEGQGLDIVANCLFQGIPADFLSGGGGAGGAFPAQNHTLQLQTLI